MAITRVDDSDRSRVVYSPANGWTANTADWGYQNTMTIGSSLGISASLNFTGTNIAVYGAMTDINRPGIKHIIKFTVDDKPGDTITFTPSPVAFIGDYNMTSVRLYESPTLPDGDHTITVTNMVELNNLVLDYFEVGAASVPNVVSGPISTLSAGSATGVAWGSSSGESRGKSPGAIAGAFFGGLALGAIIASMVIFVLLRRRNRARIARESGQAPHAHWNAGASTVVIQPKVIFVSDMKTDVAPAYTVKQ